MTKTRHRTPRSAALALVGQRAMFRGTYAGLAGRIPGVSAAVVTLTRLATADGRPVADTAWCVLTPTLAALGPAPGDDLELEGRLRALPAAPRHRAGAHKRPPEDGRVWLSYPTKLRKLASP